MISLFLTILLVQDSVANDTRCPRNCSFVEPNKKELGWNQAIIRTDGRYEIDEKHNYNGYVDVYNCKENQHCNVGCCKTTRSPDVLRAKVDGRIPQYFFPCNGRSRKNPYGVNVSEWCSYAGGLINFFPGRNQASSKNRFWMTNAFGRHGECSSIGYYALTTPYMCDYKPSCFWRYDIPGFGHGSGDCQNCAVDEKDGGCKVPPPVIKRKEVQDIAHDPFIQFPGKFMIDIRRHTPGAYNAPKKNQAVAKADQSANIAIANVEEEVKAIKKGNTLDGKVAGSEFNGNKKEVSGPMKPVTSSSPDTIFDSSVKDQTNPEVEAE